MGRGCCRPVDQRAGLSQPGFFFGMVWGKHQGRDLALSTLMFKEYTTLLVSNKVKVWVSIQKKPGDKLKGMELSVEARLSVYRVWG